MGATAGQVVDLLIAYTDDGAIQQVAAMRRSYTDAGGQSRTRCRARSW